jgi:hypothetical protein
MGVYLRKSAKITNLAAGEAGYVELRRIRRRAQAYYPASLNWVAGRGTRFIA